MSLFKHEFHEDKSDEYATPRSFVDPIAEAVGGFDLDPASGAEDRPIASTRYTEEDDGLSQDWFGTVWLNPPFSEKTEFVEKARTEYHDGNIDLAVILLPVDTSTSLFHQHVVDAEVLWFKKSRLSFDGPGGRNRNPNFGVMLAVYGDAPDELIELLSHRGTVFDRRERYQRSEQQRLITDGGADKNQVQEDN